ncbi:MAG: hypothetical protein ACOYI5_04820 [Christensenellales bacterium]
MMRTIYHVAGSPNGDNKVGGKRVAIYHMELGKITKRKDGRYQAGYRDINGKRKFITCRTEEEVMRRFRALQVTQEVEIKKEPVGSPQIDQGTGQDLRLANYALYWLERFKRGKI